MQQHNTSVGQNHDYSSVMQLLSAIGRGRFRIATEQEVLKAKTKEVTSGITGSKTIDSMLKTGEQRQKDFLNHVGNNISERSAYKLTDYKLLSEKRAGGKSTAVIDVLRAVQNKNVSVESAYNYLQANTGQIQKSAVQLNQEILGAAERDFMNVHKSIPQNEQGIINNFKQANYAPKMKTQRATPEQDHAQAFNADNFRNFRDRQLRDLEARANATMAQHAKSYGYNGAPSAGSELVDTFKTIETFATQQIDKMSKMGIPAEKIRTAVLNSVQEASMQLPKGSEMDNLFNDLKVRVNNNIEHQLGSRMDLKRESLRMS